MKRTTISLPEETAKLLEHEARRRSCSVSEVTRQALAEHLGTSGRPREIPFAALGSSGQRHNARDMEEILATEWDRDRGS
jgi:Arc/MetJ-type ribon-helix-helix transcriptional regulator